MFSKTNSNSLWVLLLEKAFAKLHGGYKTLTGGNENEALMDLTGAPTMSLNFKDKKVKDLINSGKLWDLIMNFEDEGYILSAATPYEPLWIVSNDNNGMTPGQGFTVVGVKEAKGNKLINLRNTLANFEWDGDWCQSSALWTEDIIEIAKPNLGANDGTFWISFKDFVEMFDSLDICRVRNWDEVRIRGRFIRFQDAVN